MSGSYYMLRKISSVALGGQRETVYTHTKYFCTTGTAVVPDMTFRTRWPLWDVGGDGQYTPVVGITAQGSKNCWHEGQSESHQR